jgi:hypothetical protein
MTEYTPEIRETTVFADSPNVLLAKTTRFEYLNRYLPLYKNAIRWKWYAIGLAIVGLCFLASFPAITLATWFGAAYYYQRREQMLSRLTSPRKVIWGH